ncbi:replicative DNA helicase [Spiroplasma sp. TIUS-1]|uniref:replicative DNA helicase n=1 Tax=Spiroplasma sp. TIUS-1 TaxID=216963 RepID=UPI00139962AD|nr:replicative DNA helicase [Spiroplasma sp. TIUS-1]QHX35579.1 replicative DNA helicase [Spiroplasma sp. TIUS-1]
MNNQEMLERVEADLLAMAMNSETVAYEVISNLNKNDFSTEKHSIIFEAISHLVSKNIVVSTTQISDYLETEKKLEIIGGRPTIYDITTLFFTDEGYSDLLDVVMRHSKGRQLDKILDSIKNSRNEGGYIDQIIASAQEKILGINMTSKKDEPESVKDILGDVIKHMQELSERSSNKITGVDTGFSELNKITDGFQKSDLVILAARPSMGKTAFALNLAFNASDKMRKEKGGVAFFSLEMPKEQLVQRMISSVGGIDGSQIRNARNVNWANITDASDILREQNIIIDDTASINVLQIQSKLRKMKHENNIKIAFIDYLQLINSINPNPSGRQQEVSEISRQLKTIARTLEIPIICLSQLSRSVEKREDKTPMMSDLRDSGAIEQDADIIMFLYREGYYKKEELESTNTDVIIAKHRNGAIGTISLDFIKTFGKFENKKM